MASPDNSVITEESTAVELARPANTCSIVTTSLLATVAMCAFAGNSLLCRAALLHTAIDPVTFTAVRVLSGAAVLWTILQLRGGSIARSGNWLSAFALFAYALGFSLAYTVLSAGTGALLLFGAVQATMIGYGLWNGERLTGLRLFGLIAAAVGMIGLMLPGVSAPPIIGAVLMFCAGIAWGVYSLRGRREGDPTNVTAGNFVRAAPFALAIGAGALRWGRIDQPGLILAVASGALTSGLGYAVWYSVLPKLKATNAATLQLSVPVITAITAVLLLGEPLTLRLVIASAVILGGVAVVVFARSRP
jgi:drug/metabolite transporter (DMT)-like permease